MCANNTPLSKQTKKNASGNSYICYPQIYLALYSLVNTPRGDTIGLYQ